MSDLNERLQKLSPDALLQGFSRTPMARYVTIAVAAHLVLVGLTSFAFIRDTWIDPEGARARQEALLAEQEAERAARIAAAAGEATTEDDAPADAAAPGEEAPEAAPAATRRGPLDEEALYEERRDTDVIRQLEEVADPADIPDLPDSDLPPSLR